jgi:hypothetical protein
MRESPCVAGACTQAGAGRTGSEPVGPCLTSGPRSTDMHDQGLAPGRTSDYGEHRGPSLSRSIAQPRPPPRARPTGAAARRLRSFDPLAAAPRSWLLQAGGMGTGGVPDGGSVTHPRAAVLTPFDQRFTVILLRGPGAYGAGGSCRRPVTKSGSNLSAATARQPTLVRSW